MSTHAGPHHTSGLFCTGFELCCVAQKVNRCSVKTAFLNGISPDALETRGCVCLWWRMPLHSHDLEGTLTQGASRLTVFFGKNVCLTCVSDKNRVSVLSGALTRTLRRNRNFQGFQRQGLETCWKRAQVRSQGTSTHKRSTLCLSVCLSVCLPSPSLYLSPPLCLSLSPLSLFLSLSLSLSLLTSERDVAPPAPHSCCLEPFEAGFE